MYLSSFNLLLQGGSWDDNSVGHGSVAARMRRERNRAIRRTQSTATYTNNPVDTHGKKQDGEMVAVSVNNKRSY